MAESCTRASACALHVEHYGAGPEVVLVHGWGLHGGVWGGLIQPLQERWRLSVVELPGHGSSADCEQWDLDRLVDWLGARLPGPRIWVGWSLGALACLQLARRRPQQVRALGLLSATARFTTAADWPHATSPALLNLFAEELQHNAQSLLLRFLGLQVQGAQEAKGNLKALRDQWSSRPPARLSGLSNGLEILRTADLRPHLAEVVCPALVVAGDKDRVVPPEASAALAGALPNARLEMVAGAGHAPFVAQPALVAGYLADFFQSLPAAPVDEARS